MVNFKETTLNPLVAAVAKKIEEALKTSEETARAEKLLDVKKDSLDQFEKVIAREDEKYNYVRVFLFATFGVTTALTGGALGVVLPFATGALLFTGGIGILWSLMDHNANTRRAQDTVKQKINTEVFKLIESQPQEMLKSPRVLQELKDQFNPASADDKSYEALVTKAAPFTSRKLIHTDERLQKLVSEARRENKALKNTGSC